MSATPYLLVADIHAHSWSTFATVNASGENSRLRIILDELQRAAEVLLDAGGDTIVIAGDLFHVRGAIDPEVFNPVHACIKHFLVMGLKIIAIPGNHDLKGKETTEIGNAFQSLGALDGFTVVTQAGLTVSRPTLAMVPWAGSKEKLRNAVADLQGRIGKVDLPEMDLILHVGIDGMLDEVPDSGLSAKEVASWGFKRVFAGDYHNHRVAEDGKVISIGATTHQTFSDIGTKAGFLLVYPDRVEYQASHAPSFVEITDEDDPDEIPLIVDGNYVRVRGFKLTDAELKTFRDNLEEMGARGVTFQVAREVVGARTGSAVAKAATLDESIGKFIDTLTLPDPSMLGEVKIASIDILDQVRAVAT